MNHISLATKTSLMLLGAFWVPMGVSTVQAQNVSTQANASTQKPLSYEQLRRSHKVDARVTWDKVRADSASHAGRVIEISGQVTGQFSVQGSRTLMLRVGGAAVSLAVPGNFQSAALRTGNGVRALAMVNRAEEIASATSPLLTLVAVETRPLPPAESNTQTNSSTQLLSAPISADSLDPIAVLPNPPDAKPVTTPMTRMQPLASRSGSPIQRAQTDESSASQTSGPANEDGWLDFFKSTVRRHNSRLSGHQVEQIASALIGAGREQAIDPRFIASIIAVESNFNIHALSRSGAMGLGQIMPFNLKEARITNAWDPAQNIYGTARLLKGHLNQFGSRPNGTLLAVAAYNAGPNAVKRAGYKVPNGSQVQRYVWKVYYKYKSLAPELF